MCKIIILFLFFIASYAFIYFKKKKKNIKQQIKENKKFLFKSRFL